MLPLKPSVPDSLVRSSNAADVLPSILYQPSTHPEQKHKEHTRQSPLPILWLSWILRSGTVEQLTPLPAAG